VASGIFIFRHGAALALFFHTHDLLTFSKLHSFFSQQYIFSRQGFFLPRLRSRTCLSIFVVS